VVKEALAKNSGVFEMSDGAVVFKGEKYGLHTRVFVNSLGLPTYESKEIGLNFTKFKDYPDAARSVIVTASEQNDYFRVLIKVLSIVFPAIGEKTKHIGHGMMRFASGKMSSRTGKVVTAEDLIDDIRDMVKAKIVGREYTSEEVEKISDIVAIGAIKYTILRSSAGSDIVFDSTASISFEGDSGPYLQYSAVRAASILAKAKEAGIAGSVVLVPEKVGTLEKLLSRYEDVLALSVADLSAHHVAGYLSALASAFNAFYAGQIIVEKDDKLSPYYVAITRAFYEVITDGLWVLGIKVPEKM
jgi:arginyl-tRNA synthetase